MSSPLLSRSDLLNAVWRYPRPVRVEVPHLGGHLYVRLLSRAERDRYEAEGLKLVDGKMVPDLENASARLLLLCLCDQDSKRLLEDDDAQLLGDLPALWLEELLREARRVNAMSAEAQGELEKNSEKAAGCAS